MPDLQTLSVVVIPIGLIITAAFIVLIADWRLALFALAAHYIVVAALLAQLIPLPMALVRVVSGGLAMLILYFTARQQREEYRRARRAAAETELAAVEQLYRRAVFAVGFSFRLFALALVAVGILGIASSMSFLGLPPDILFSGMWLSTTGILVAILSRDVLRLGVGILVFTSGFSILETATETSLLLYGLLNIADLLLALAIAHLSALPQPREAVQ